MEYFLKATEQRHQKRDAEVHHKSVEDGHHDQFLSCRLSDDRQGGVHRGGASGRDGSQPSEPTHQERCTQQRHQLAGNVGQEGDGSRLGSFVFGDEDARQGVVAEARTDGEAVRQAAVRQEQADECRPCQRPDDGRDGQEDQSRIERTEVLQRLRVVAHADTDARHQRAEGIETDAAAHVSRQEPREAAPDAQHEEPHDDETSAERVQRAALRRTGSVGRRRFSLFPTRQCPPQEPGRRHAAQCSAQRQHEGLQPDGVQAADNGFIATYLDAQQEEQRPDKHGDGRMDKAQVAFVQ